MINRRKFFTLSAFAPVSAVIGASKAADHHPPMFIEHMGCGGELEITKRSRGFRYRCLKCQAAALLSYPPVLITQDLDTPTNTGRGRNG